MKFIDFKKLNLYFKNYLCAHKWIRVLLIPALLVLGLANYLELQSSKKITAFAKNISTEASTLTLITLFILFYNILKMFFDFFTSYMVSYIVRKAYADFFGEFLQIKHCEFFKHGIGEKHYNVRRRAVAVSMFFTTFFVNFILNFMFFCFAVGNICVYIQMLSALKLFLILTMFIICVISIQYFRSIIRRKANVGFEKGTKKLYDMLFNYERIVAYNNHNIESNKYFEALDDQCKYNQFFWVSFEFGNLLTEFLFALLGVFIFSELHKTKNISDDKAIELAAIVSTLIKKLSEKLTTMTRLISTLVTNYTNFTQSIIENAEYEKTAGGVSIKTFDESITVSDLEFKYGEKIIFTDVSCKIQKGEKIAIVGPNGVGKSTFLKMFLKFYDFEGSIEIDGWDFLTMDCVQTRKFFSYIPQDTQLFDKSILENLKSGNEQINSEEIIALCDKFNYHTLFKKLGYDKKVGSRGKNLSGGEKQKIAFMRAVIRNSPVILMDEPTANLDVNSEEEFIKNIVKHLKTKTVLMIVHNLQTLHFFDKIYFFNNKTLFDTGSFDDVYKRNKTFRNFYTLSQNDK
ncbi:ATM1 [Ecytonucleospora hepatopenaei]|uniref:ATM1 n=1 Tax=Ecytonucleospora hepatopenaei TaxID=646526 RepID=A0A1W0E5M6_9MICR|nr:ATM1 [Ecytonucleospora hepatopenaei]